MAVRLILKWIIGLFACYHVTVKAAAVPEADMRAAYLYNFAQFTVWEPNDQVTFNICTSGKLTDNLSPEVFANKYILGKKIKLTRYVESANKNECQILYLNSGDAGYDDKIANALVNAPVLTVGDEGNGFGPGMINLAVKSNRLAFNLDLSRLRKANLSLSSKLISLAQKVRE